MLCFLAVRRTPVSCGFRVGGFRWLVDRCVAFSGVKDTSSEKLKVNSDFQIVCFRAEIHMNTDNRVSPFSGFGYGMAWVISLCYPRYLRLRATAVAFERIQP